MDEMMGSRITIAALASAVALATCTTTTGPQANVTGSWTLNGVFAGQNDTLEITGLVMTLTQSGGTFVGEYSGAVLAVYSRPTYASPTVAPRAGQILLGKASGASVTFALDNAGQPFQGVATDSAMQGSGTVYYLGSQSPHTYTGTWNAAKN
jgi:hypothetical protein